MQTCDQRQDVVFSWILRIGVAMEFVGHGMLGLGHPAAWASYFAVLGVPREPAFRLMPMIGAFDLTMALMILAFPFRGLIGYMAVWGLWTALLRPLAGESLWETIERAGNYGTPLALFLMFGGAGWKSWFGSHILTPVTKERKVTISRVLQWTTALLLIGHGALGLLIRKPLFAMQYTYLGGPGTLLEPWIGAFEMLLGASVLWKVGRGLLFFILIWKLATEALSPIAGTPIWVFVEHGGSYAAPLALYLWQKSAKPVDLGGFQSA